VSQLDNLTGRAAIAELLRQASERIAALPFTERTTVDGLGQMKRALTAVESALRALGEDPDQPSLEQLHEFRPVQVAHCWFCHTDFPGDTKEAAIAAYIAHTCDPGPPPVVPWEVLIGTHRSTARCGMRR
jgi:hypothetical protein